MATMTIQQAFEFALQHHQAGRLADAERLYRQILTRQPNHADAMHLLGVLSHQTGNNNMAVELIRRSIAIDPHYPAAYCNLGNILREEGRLEESIAACRAALGLQPEYPEALSNLGSALREAGQLDEAIAACRRAVDLKPGYFDALGNLGNALRDRGRLDEALTIYRQAIELKPADAKAHSNLGNALYNKGQLDEAIVAYRHAIALDPNFSQAYSNLGNAQRDKGQLDEAIASYRQAIALKLDLPDAHANLGNALKDAGRLDEAIAAYRHALALKPSLHEAHGNLVYSLHFHPDYSAPAIADELRGWSRQHAQSLKPCIRAHANDRCPNRRLRIGYVSPDFRMHPVGRFLMPLLACHDKLQVETFAYSQALVHDAMTQRLRSHADCWREIAGLSDGQVAELIRADQIDILVDLTMHMANSRLLVFARKPAPVQVTYLAYCSSTGLEAIDYRLSDPYVDPFDAAQGGPFDAAHGAPPGENELIYSEKTIRLPETYWCYQPHIATPDVGPLPAAERGHITFGCLNNFCKVGEPTLAAWAKLLQTVGNSQLLLHAHEGSHRQRLLDRLQREGIEPKRIQFVKTVPPAEYFALHQGIDIALDTFPYGGGTTTCDALWMGVPVVSLIGKTAVGRGGLSILSNVGLPELAARSEYQYVAIASELAGDLARLANLRSSLRRQMQASPLMDAPRFARAIESTYRQMWRNWCASGG